jgi:nucleoid DNA-binding protein
VNKSQLISVVAAETSTKIVTATKIVNSIFATIQANAAKSEKTTIHGFGAFRPVEYHARTGDNPRTHEPIEIPAFRTVAFKFSTVAKDQLNQGVKS